jgi:hypothetical protein
MATKHQLEKGMLQPSNPWNPDKSVGSSSSKKNLYSSDIGVKFLRFCMKTMEEKQAPSYKQKIQFLKVVMPEWKEMNTERQFRLWKTNKKLYLFQTECKRYDALFDCRSAAADDCEGEGGSNGQSMEAEIFPIRPEFSTNALQAILLVIKPVLSNNHVQV